MRLVLALLLTVFCVSCERTVREARGHGRGPTHDGHQAPVAAPQRLS